MTDTTSNPTMVDAVPPEAQADAVQWLLQSQQAGSLCWVLLDRGFLSDSDWSDLEKAYAPTCIYTGRLAGAEQVAPHLIPVPDPIAEQETKDWLAGLYACSQGRPMLSYLSTPAGLDAADWLQARSCLTEAETKAHFMARLADTRCLPQLVAVFTPQQQAAFFAGIQD